MTAVAAAVSRATAEDFLFEEAALLDDWQLERWLGLFQENGRYEVPTGDCPDGDPYLDQSYVSDDWLLLNARVARLLSRNAHAENPRSRTHRMISNVQVEPVGERAVLVRANFIIHRLRDDRIDPYFGRYAHLMTITEAGLRFTRRRSILATKRLQPAGRLSFIL